MKDEPYRDIQVKGKNQKDWVTIKSSSLDYYRQLGFELREMPEQPQPEAKGEITAEGMLKKALGEVRYNLYATGMIAQVTEAMHEYARLCVEADRKRIIEECTAYKEFTCECTADGCGYIEADRNAIEVLPITLP